MTVFKNELRKSKTSLFLWTLIVTFMMVICIVLYPQMTEQMNQISESFADMGSFSAAFGMDKINFGEFIGYFSVECGNVLGLGGAFFAALIGITALAGEEKDHTAEFLFSHPISRTRVVAEKLLAAFTELLIFNGVAVTTSLLCFTAIDEHPDAKIIVLLFLSYFLLQVETMAICFGVSAFIRHGELGIGLGTAATFYFFNIVANLTDQVKIMKYFTPFSYCEGADILTEKALHKPYLAVGMAATLLSIFLAFYHYRKKDLT